MDIQVIPTMREKKIVDAAGSIVKEGNDQVDSISEEGGDKEEIEIELGG